MADEICFTAGNSDLYGGGIRLGIYFRFFSSLLANRRLATEVQGVWDTNSIFLLAVFAAVAKATIDQSIRYVEAFVMPQLMLAFLLVAIPRPFLLGILRGYLTPMGDTELQILEKRMKGSSTGENWRTELGVAIACYNVWFWFRFDPPKSCKAYVFLATRVHADCQGID